MNVEDVVELRVHGVSGTPPQDLLDRREVDLIAGDRTAGFFRPHYATERDDDFPPGDPDLVVHGPRLEGYAWGGLTSGAPSRAFWLLLLPFTLINVAPRLRPADPDPGSDSGKSDQSALLRLRLLWLVCRLLALTLTLVLVAAFVGIGVDLIGWQCGAASGRCGKAAPGWLFDPIRHLSTAHRMALGLVVPVGMLFLLWLVSKRTINRYERVRATGRQPDAMRAAEWNEADPADAVEVPLASRWMWQNELPVRRLRAIHLQCGVAAALAFAAAPMGGWRWLDGVLAVVVIGYSSIVLTVPSYTGHTAAMHWRKVSYGIWAAVVLAAAGTIAWLLWRPHDFPENGRQCVVTDVAVGRSRPRFDCSKPQGLPHYAATILWLLIVELLLVLVLLAVVLVSRRRAGTARALGAPGPPAGLGGMGTAIMALLAVFLASVFTAGAYMFTAAWLTSGSLHPSLRTISTVSRIFRVPESILDAGFAYSLAVGLGAIMLGARIIWFGWSMLHIRANNSLLVPGSFGTDYPAEDPDSPRGRSILRAMWLGRLVDVVGAMLARLVLIGALLSYFIGGVLVAEHVFGANRLARWLLDPAQVGSNPFAEPAFFSPQALQGKGAYLAVWSIVLLVVLGGAAFRVAPTRRSVGILWDLASFWPRVSHPLAAPCYAERTVPDLVTRISFHADDGCGVVLAAHSQGTVIGAATVLQLRMLDEHTPDRPTLPRVGLLTFGCVLRRLYGRYFPAYFGPAAMDDVRCALRAQDGTDQRWRNLWRYTDYLGGPVTEGPPPVAEPPWNPRGQVVAYPPGPNGLMLDLHLVDPPFGIAPGDTVYPPPLRHSDFWKVPQFQLAVVHVAGLIPEPGDVRPTT